MSIITEKIRRIQRKVKFMKEIDPDSRPNFSALARETGISRQTIARIWKQSDEPKTPRRSRRSKFDPYQDEIRRKFEEAPRTIKSVFKYLQARHPGTVFNSYNSFKSYVKKHELTKARQEYLKARPRYETGAGQEVQLDWKESLRMTLKTGEVIDYNIFVAVYGYSRFVKLVYSKTKTTDDFIRCLIEVVSSAGGKPKKFKTDNMSAIVTVNGARKQKLPVIRQLEKDMGTRIELCKVRNPQSKGKVESANRLLQWLQPYQGELESEEELIETIRRINIQINQEASRTTGQVRALLMREEKEHLHPQEKPLLLESYLEDTETQVVPATLMVTWKGHGYSVPAKLAGKRVKLHSDGSELQIYYNQKLICTHPLSTQPFNYQPEHYMEALKSSLPKKDQDSPEDYEEMIRRKAEESLRHMKNLKGKVK